MKTKEELIEWLRDAYAMEKAMELALKKQVENQTVAMLVREQAAKHLSETQHHAEMVGACLKKLGSETSTLKTAMAKGLEIMKGASTAFAGDHRVKDLLGMCATEHFEIACYTALRAGAARFGIYDIVETCGRILKDEQRMADWLEANLPHVVTSYLEDSSGSAGYADAEDDDMPETFTFTGSQTVLPDPAPVASPPVQDLDAGSNLISPKAEAAGRPPLAHVQDEQAEFVLSPTLKDEPAAPRAPAASPEATLPS